MSRQYLGVDLPEPARDPRRGIESIGRALERQQTAEDQENDFDFATHIEKTDKAKLRRRTLNMVQRTKVMAHGE